MSPRFAGVIITVLFHAVLMTVCVKSGLKYIYPPPEEKSMVIEFEPEPEPPVEDDPSSEIATEAPPEAGSGEDVPVL